MYKKKTIIKDQEEDNYYRWTRNITIVKNQK
jgi:hypothetical protein